jgi:hypothetical protein
MFDCGLGRQKRPKHVDIEHPAELFLGNGFDRCKFVNSRVINQDIEPPVVFNGRVDDTLRFRSLALGNDPDNGSRRSEWHQGFWRWWLPGTPIAKSDAYSTLARIPCSTS